MLRGYEDFDKKLQGLGAEIRLAETDEEVKKIKFQIS